jgi:hypothetical protein
MLNFVDFAIFSETDEIGDFHFLVKIENSHDFVRNHANFVAMNEFFAKNSFLRTSELSLNTLSRARERI